MSEVSKEKSLTANELRIGNFANRHFENGEGELTECTVRDIFDCKRSTLEPDFKFHYTGIPLNEEWLIKLGAEAVGEFKIFENFLIELGRNRRLSISVQPGNQYIWIQEYTKENRTTVNDLVCLFNGDYDGTLYVHTLQNIFFSIKREELKLSDYDSGSSSSND